MTTTAQAARDARSLLFVPGDRPERFAKAVATGADAIVIDLEDAVAPDAKQAALEHALAWLAGGGAAVVRVNGVGTRWHTAEVAALATTSAALMVPKSHSRDELASVHAVVGDRLIALVETARGIRDADLVASSPGVVRIALGNVDLSAELGVDPASHAALAYARGRLIVASSAAGIAAPVDGVTTALDDPAVLATDLAATRELGFGGKLCIHPRQVQPVNAALSPSADEIIWARHIVESAPAEGVSVVDGRMIDAPVIARAARILARERA
ncbi:HpcH/HpaI aldolase/citrate lyase family protein [Aeromicrobium yanjiei]|uniref:CoA ester lyase n=1 Tax=Aeromicrobium yanjiei TaxID=2662028 RepID=A0A5Q2MFU3_9ACTN|nr:CoA ester lyase [Aeromicrobium yanjiei]QGG40593.1 CoA ester lyase [Aeromicrobium yanjiei]